jgi:hypothetical protein
MRIARSDSAGDTRPPASILAVRFRWMMIHRLIALALCQPSPVFVKFSRPRYS